MLSLKSPAASQSITHSLIDFGVDFVSTGLIAHLMTKELYLFVIFILVLWLLDNVDKVASKNPKFTLPAYRGIIFISLLYIELSLVGIINFI